MGVKGPWLYSVSLVTASHISLLPNFGGHSSYSLRDIGVHTDKKTWDIPKSSKSLQAIHSQTKRSQQEKAQPPCQLSALLSTPSLSLWEQSILSSCWASTKCLCRCHAAGRRTDEQTSRWQRDRDSETETDSKNAFGLKDNTAAAWFGFPLPLSYPSPLSLSRRWLASADHLAGAWEQLPPSQGHSKVCSRARWVCSDSRHIHEGSWSEAAASQKLEDRLIG